MLETGHLGAGGEYPLSASSLAVTGLYNRVLCRKRNVDYLYFSVGLRLVTEAIMKARNLTRLLVITGCVTLTPNIYAQANTIPIASGAVASSDKATPADRKLARDVRKALSRAPNFNVSNVFVTARGGVVTLSGSVSDGVQIQQASEVAMGVPGVVSVSNQLSMYTRGY
jgi:hyperosmotically inducible periplasmic protein